MSGNFVSYQDADALMTKIAQKISGGGGGGTDKAILYYMTDNAMYEGYHVRATGLLSGTVYNTVLDSEGNGDVEVEGMERYSINFYYIDENEQEVSVYQTAVDAHTGNFVYIPLGYDKTSWQGIQNILDAHKEMDLLSIGDEIHTSIGGADVVFQIAALDLYDTHEVIFVAKNIYTNRKFNESNTLGVGWSTCSLRTYLNETFKGFLEEDIQKNMKQLSIWTGYQGSSDNYVWVPREYEYLGSIYRSAPAEANYCNQYPIFAIIAQRIRTYNGVAATWYTASRYNSTEYGTCWVGSNGSANGDYNMNTDRGILPCFRFTANK